MSIIELASQKVAVVIGINYVGTSNELKGCINDANNIRTFLMERCGYLDENILMVCDDGKNVNPTRKNIEIAMDTMIAKAALGFTEFWLSYSGHGSYESDKNGDEKDYCDEVICPVDCDENGVIVDDYIYENLVCKIPENSTLFCLMDCCHSGTILDLPLIYSTTGQFVNNNSNNKHVAKVYSISGCKDSQTSADAYIGSTYQGAMTWSFLNALSNAKYNITLVDLVERMKVLLREKYTQIPMLAISSAEQSDILFMRQQSVSLTQLPVASRSVLFKMSVDYWFAESSWNVQSFATKQWIFSTFATFKSKYETVEIVKDLKPGLYMLRINDSYGDGGVTALVTCGLITLLTAKMTSGRSVTYEFIV